MNFSTIAIIGFISVFILVVLAIFFISNLELDLIKNTRFTETLNTYGFVPHGLSVE